MSILRSRAINIPVSILGFGILLFAVQWFFMQNDGILVSDARANTSSSSAASSATTSSQFTCSCTVESDTQVVYEDINYTNNISQAWNDCEQYNVNASNFCGSEKTVKKVCVPVFGVERGTGYDYATTCSCRIETLPISFMKPVPTTITTTQEAQQFCQAQSAACGGIYSSQFNATKTCTLMGSTTP